MTTTTPPNRIRCALALAVTLAATTLSAGVTDMKQGQGGSVVQGAAGTQGAQGDTGLRKCTQPLGAVAVVEPQDYIMASLARYSLQSPTSLIRLMIQQSNCFIVVERGMGMQNMMQERALADSGQLRSSSNIGQGQMVAADFVLTPSVVFSDDNAGAVGGAIGGLLGGKARVIGGLVGGLKFKEAQTSMLLSDARTSVQVAAAQGSTKKADLRLGAALFGGGAFGAVGGYGNTNEGKIISAALLDNYNNIVRAVKGDESLQRDVGSLKQEAAKGGKAGGGIAYNEGDVVTPKIANVKLLASPADTAKAVATLQRGEELVIIGPEENGFLNVQGGSASGWIKKVLVNRP